MRANHALVKLERNPRLLQCLNLYKEHGSYAAVGREMGISSTLARMLVLKASDLEEKTNYGLSTCLSPRAHRAIRNILETHEPVTPQQVAKLRASDLFKEPNAGQATVEEIRTWLEDHGLCLEGDISERERQDAKNPPATYVCPHCGGSFKLRDLKQSEP